MRQYGLTFSNLLGYALVSVLALAADVLVLSTLTHFRVLPYYGAAPVAFLSGGVVAYALSVRNVFHFRRVRSVPLEFSVFLLLGLVGAAINSAVIAVFVGLLAVPLLTAKLFAAGCTFTTNYLLRSYYLFRSPDTRAAGEASA